ncbi:MAG: S8/S53 family peptidase [Chitinophagales bacterium]|nr:S8/S53 family peptidase [Chitinophagales bacterium]
MKKIPLILLLLATIALFNACKDELSEMEETHFAAKTDTTIYTIEEIDAIFAAKNYQLDWKTERNAKFIYSIAMHTDSMIAIGYKPTNMGNLSEVIHTLDLTTAPWTTIEQMIIDSVAAIEQQNRANIIIKPSPKLPALIVKVSSIKTVQYLTLLHEADFLEPMNDYFYERGEMLLSSGEQDMLGFTGCSCNTPTPYHPDDASNIAPGCIRPWNYEYHHINEETWAISSGAGIGVAVIDSGVSDDQENLDGGSGGTFNSGYSEERSQDEFNYLPYRLVIETPSISPPNLLPSIREEHDPNLTAHDRCGHGTRMAGLVGAPRGEDGNAVGVAYNCNLVCFRAVHNPIISTMAEKTGVTQSLVHIANDPDIHIVSMSIGQSPLGAASPLIGYALDFAYNSGKMLACAAGTGGAINNIIFPASHTKTIAITGIKTPINILMPLTLSDDPCNICFYNEAVDFAVVMQRVLDNTRTTLTATCDGDAPLYSTGSSCATATFSGMAALVWSHLGTGATREEVLQKMQESASNPVGDHANFGYGWVDMAKALEE